MTPTTLIRILCSGPTLWLALSLLAGACGDDSGKSSDEDNNSTRQEECAPGSAGCECASGERCDDGLSCEEGMCGAGTTLPPLAFPAQARSCELLLREQGAAVIGIDFASDTAGTFIREAPRVAVALHATDDAPMGDLSVRVAAGGELPEAELVTCFDASGETLSDVELSFGG